MKKKILIANKFFFPPVVGGVESVVAQHAEMLAEQGFDVTVLVFRNSSHPPNKHKYKFKLIEIKSTFTVAKTPIGLKYALAFFNLLREADLVIGHYPFPLFDFLCCIACLKNRKPNVVVYWHSDIHRQKVLKWLVEPFTQIMLANCTVLCSSKALASSSPYIAERAGVKIIPIAVTFPNLQLLPRSPVCLPLDQRNRQLPSEYALFFGRLTPYKNVEWICRLAVDHPEINFVVCGNGEQAGLLERAVRKCANIYWISRFVEEDEKLAIFYKSYVYLFPSNLENEAFGITQVESLSVGTPVINQDLHSGVPEVTSGIKNCVTVSRGDYEGFSLSVFRAHENRYQSNFARERIAISASRRFSYESVSRLLAEVITEKLAT